MRRSAALQNFLDAFAQNSGMTYEEKRVLDIGGSHQGSCTCDTCRKYWALMGPDEEGKYGPWTLEELEEELQWARELRGAGDE